MRDSIANRCERQLRATTAHLNAGAAYVFVRSGTSWSQEAYLKASNTDCRDDFGMSVAAVGRHAGDLGAIA